MYPRSESNRDRQNRNLKFYPLNYRGIPVWDCKFSKNYGFASILFPIFESQGKISIGVHRQIGAQG